MNSKLNLDPLTQNNVNELIKLTKTLFQELNLVPEFHGQDQDLTAPLKAYQPPQGNLWLARKEGQEAAVGMVGILPITRRTCEIRRLYILPDARRHGYGRVLLDQALAFAKKAEYLEILVALHHQQTAALAIFDKNGYKPCARFNASRQAGIFLSLKISADI